MKKPEIDEQNLLLWAKSRTLSQLARMHLTTEEVVQHILDKHGVTIGKK